MVHVLGCLLKKEGEKSKADVVDLLNYEKIGEEIFKTLTFTF